MEDNAMFRIPTSGSLSDPASSAVQTIAPVELDSAPYKVETETKNATAPSTLSIYDELSAISEEVLACRKAVLERI